MIPSARLLRAHCSLPVHSRLVPGTSACAAVAGWNVLCRCTEPADIGMEEAGLAETVAQAVQAAHPHLHALLYSNILLTGWKHLLEWWSLDAAIGPCCFHATAAHPRLALAAANRLPAWLWVQAARRGAPASGTDCMRSCGRWCLMITRWVCLVGGNRRAGPLPGSIRVAARVPPPRGKASTCHTHTHFCRSWASTWRMTRRCVRGRGPRCWRHPRSTCSWR